ncbi:hypothetical protein OEZ86_000275 [Tetradesmus obliquus]|nr:hypothetical protein OEZ86_000275 [Tetradesmus obliquus]
MSQPPAYAPPVVYQQGAAPAAPYGSGYQQAAPYPTYPASGGAPGGVPPASAGWGAMGASPYPQQQQQQPYGQAPYPSQQPYPQQQQQPYPQQQQQQQPYQQQAPYPQQQQQAGQDTRTSFHFGQSSMNQHYSTPGQAPYMPPTTYSPAPQPQAGRKKALLIGCAYPGTSQALNGCINDVQCIEYCLKHRFGFVQPGSIVVLRDDQRSKDHVSTRANIVRGIQWLMQDQRPGDSLFFHFSGHGSQQADTTGDELDGQDETILPTDFNSAGVIVDDELNAMMVRPLAPGVTLHALIDACHSGTAMDLPYRAKQGSDGRFAWKLKTRIVKGTSGGTAFQFGACKDSQVAADTNSMSGSAYTGAATYSFIDAVERYGTQQTYASLLQHMMETLRKQAGGGGGLSMPALPGGLGSMAGKLAGALGGMGGTTGAAVGLVSSFLLGPGALGEQVPVICCDKQVDLYAARLAI